MLRESQLDIFKAGGCLCAECGSSDVEIAVWTKDLHDTPSEYFAPNAPLLRCRGCDMSAIKVVPAPGVMSEEERDLLMALDDIDLSACAWAHTSDAVVNDQARTIWIMTDTGGRRLSRVELVEFLAWMGILV